MIEKNKGKKFTENAFLVGAVHSDLTPAKVNEHLHELELLAQTAGANIVHHFVQKLNKNRLRILAISENLITRNCTNLSFEFLLEITKRTNSLQKI